MQHPPLIEIYNCLCDETRLRIVHLLAQAPLFLCHLQDILGLTQVAASKNLAYLRKRGIVESRRHEQWMIYSLPAGRPLELDWQLRCLQDCLPTHPIFRDDLRKLKARQSDCGWMAEAVEAAPAPGRSISKTKRGSK
ncbi:MAG: ArsR family transcriptional regulator [Pedosphaera sp.]|nr:ArsR family transcriptional regulator [Pedosphaera sp.]